MCGNNGGALESDRYFHDTDDELEFEQNLTRHIASTRNNAFSKESQTVQTVYLRTLEEELAFSDNCTSCKKNREFMFNLAIMGTEQNSVCPSTSDSGVNSATGSNVDKDGDNNGVELSNEQSILRDKRSFDNTPSKSKRNKSKKNTNIPNSKDVSSKTPRKPDKENEMNQSIHINTLLQEIEERRVSSDEHQTNKCTKKSLPLLHPQNNKWMKRKRVTSRDSTINLKKRAKPDYKYFKKILTAAVDTTINGHIEKALLRKLGRPSGGSQAEDSVNKNGDFRSFQTTHKVRKLYTPDDWISSTEFSSIEALEDDSYI
ncbi:hypothetical protein GWI33_007652 [Rhynchophorus ferrugineus]|uniref:Uncharacterized protein n=1 Tax=Rhynchophorus ferrugineus TaxID=354439 RepID=A0A834IJS6_RHYFE|nr:hypothetical protein GWI33_007652 [Rhynchophorus ferrugineus]